MAPRAAASEAPGHPEIVRVRAPNPGPMTLSGTNTYVVGSTPAWVIDPGPADPAHIAEVRAVAEARGGIGGVVLTHSHADHAAGVELLGAELRWGGEALVDEAEALAAALGADREAGDAEGSGRAGAAATGAGEGMAGARARAAVAPSRIGPFEVLPTPGHAADHVSFLLGSACFCGDLVLGEGSSIVPPAAAGGSLSDYMRSLATLAARVPALLCPGHGPWITDPAAKLAEYEAHRRERERRLLAALADGARDAGALLDAAWDDVPEPLRPAAALALRAHLEKLAAEDRLPAGMRW